jgi:hypothetical protein
MLSCEGFYLNAGFNFWKNIQRTHPMDYNLQAAVAGWLLASAPAYVLPSIAENHRGQDFIL